MDVIEHNSAIALNAVIEGMKQNQDCEWSAACIKRGYLKMMTNEAFLTAIRPVVEDAAEVKIYFIENQKIAILWQGNAKTVFKQLRNYIATNMMVSSFDVAPSAVVAYFDQHQDIRDLFDAIELDKYSTNAKKMSQKSNKVDAFDLDDEDDDEREHVGEAATALTITPAQSEHYRQLSAQKPYRKQLEMLIVEDQVFSQKLLFEILRGARSGVHGAPILEATQSIADAWKLFLKMAPDIVFVDLGLLDGSGHALARRIKELDPFAHVIIVTANTFEEEVNVARQNNVDGFIMKPYNKKQITDFVERYASALKPVSKGGYRAR